jgi:hypothetical protein
MSISARGRSSSEDEYAAGAAFVRQIRSSGALPADADPDALARYVLTLAWGMAVEAQRRGTYAAV